MASDTSTLIFLHLPKTGGQTLASLIRRQYPREQIYEVTRHPPEEAIERFAGFSEEERAQFRVLMGHVYFGIDELVPNRSTYFTLLRHPVERVVSTYYYVLRQPTHPAYEAIRGGNMDIAQAMREGALPMADNGQVRVLYGLHNMEVPYGCVTRAMLEKAIENLELHFAVTGITERFDETLLMLRQRFGWKNLYYRKKNVTANRPTVRALSAAALDLIREYNKLDIELYEHAAARFDSLVRGGGSSFAFKTNVFIRTNRTLNNLRTVKARVRQLVKRSSE